MLVQLGRLVSLDHASRSANVLLLKRPGAEEIGFRGTRYADEDEERVEPDAGDEDEEELVEETFGFDTILQEKWRIAD